MAETIGPGRATGSAGTPGDGAGVASARRNRRIHATVASRTCDTGSSYKESCILSPTIETNQETPAVTEREILTPALRQAQPQRSPGRFLKGPVPVHLISAAGALPGRALLVLLAILYRFDVTGGPVVSLPVTTMAEFGFDKHVKSRALEALEQAGLIQVSRTRGRPALIKLMFPSKPRAPETSSNTTASDCTPAGFPI